MYTCMYVYSICNVRVTCASYTHAKVHLIVNIPESTVLSKCLRPLASPERDKERLQSQALYNQLVPNQVPSHSIIRQRANTVPIFKDGTFRFTITCIFMKVQKVYHPTTTPKPRGIPPSASLGTPNLLNNKRQSH